MIFKFFSVKIFAYLDQNRLEDLIESSILGIHPIIYTAQNFIIIALNI